MDKGPWTIEIDEENIHICSDDFTHDVCLNISGDFKDVLQNLEYATWIRDKLNFSERLLLEQCYEKIELYNKSSREYLGGVEATRLLQNIKDALNRR